MPKRYVCTGCGKIQHRKETCGNCGEEMETIDFPWTLQTALPYIFASAAGTVLLAAYLSKMFMLIWLTFPLILIGLLIDHYYQKKLDLKAEDRIKINDGDR